MINEHLDHFRIRHLAHILTIPGLGGSGPGHWQSQWDNTHANCARVQQNDWNIPDYDDWLAGLHDAITNCPEPPVLAAHSLACPLVAHWAIHHPNTQVRGALMVAPADVDSELHTPPEARIFAPMPMAPLPFPTIVAASSNDPYVSIQRAQVFATAWGADFVNLGALGHINADSHLKDWDEGWDLLQNLVSAQSDSTLSRA